MRRRLLTILSATSLLLCVAVLGAWVRGQWATDLLRWRRTDAARNTWTGYDLDAGRYGFLLFHQHYAFERPGRALEYARAPGRADGIVHEVGEPHSNPDASSFWAWLGFGMGRNPLHYDTNSRGERYRLGSWYVRVPYWSLAMLFLGGGLPLAWRVYGRMRRGRLNGAKRCLSCGYDLRATPERCPECGHVPEPKPAEAKASRIDAALREG